MSNHTKSFWCITLELQTSEAIHGTDPTSFSMELMDHVILLSDNNLELLMNHQPPSSQSQVHIVITEVLESQVLDGSFSDRPVDLVAMSNLFLRHGKHDIGGPDRTTRLDYSRGVIS